METLLARRLVRFARELSENLFTLAFSLMCLELPFKCGRSQPHQFYSSNWK